MRSKVIQFSFSLPLTSLKKENSLFSAVKIGELVVFGRGKVLKAPEDLPEAFQAEKWIDIELTRVDYNDMDILPVFSALKECRPIVLSLIEAASNQCHTIFTENHTK